METTNPTKPNYQLDWKEITTWEKACEKTGRDPKVLPDVSMIEPGMQKYMIAAYKLPIVFEAINTDENGKIYRPNYYDGSWKYFSYHQPKKSGGGFSLSYYDDWSSDSRVGSRLETNSADKIYHINEHFEDLWIDFKLIPQE